MIDKPVVNQALDSILDMAVQLPALKKIGEELGVSVEDGLISKSDRSGKRRKKTKRKTNKTEFFGS